MGTLCGRRKLMYLKLKDMEHELYDFGNVQLPQVVRAFRVYHELE